MSWNAAGYRVTGYGHIKNQKPCQDAGAYFIAPNGGTVFVADGLGSKTHSEIGSHLAIKTAINLTKQFFNRNKSEREIYLSSLDKNKVTEIDKIFELFQEELEDPLLLMKKAFSVSRQILTEKATELSIDLQDLATTLIGALWTDDFLVLGHIGDGGIVGMNENGEIKTLSAPENGECINIVYPLTGAEALKRVRYKIIPEPQVAIALFSDGIEHKCMNIATGTAYQKFFEQFLCVLRKRRYYHKRDYGFLGLRSYKQYGY